MKTTKSPKRHMNKYQQASRRQRSVARKTMRHPMSMIIFLFYTVMSILNGSAALLALGTAAAAGACILEAIFTATSDSATISDSDRKHTETVA